MRQILVGIVIAIAIGVLGWHIFGYLLAGNIVQGVFLGFCLLMLGGAAVAAVR